MAGEIIERDESRRGQVILDYRPVHTYTMSNEASYIELKARVC